MRDKRKAALQMKVYLREGDVRHKNLRRRCDDRDRDRFKTTADYLAAAVTSFESHDFIEFGIHMDKLKIKEVQDAVNTLLKYKIEV